MFHSKVNKLSVPKVLMIIPFFHKHHFIAFFLLRKLHESGMLILELHCIASIRKRDWKSERDDSVRRDQC